MQVPHRLSIQQQWTCYNGTQTHQISGIGVPCSELLVRKRVGQQQIGDQLTQQLCVRRHLGSLGFHQLVDPASNQRVNMSVDRAHQRVSYEQPNKQHVQ
jgi:hypothetical protein